MKNNNNPRNWTDQPVLTTTPLPASRKIYIEGNQPGVTVPMREITLTPSTSPDDKPNGSKKTFLVYDTSGPYTDPDAQIDIHKGLPAKRDPWILKRQDTEERTSLPDKSSHQKTPNRPLNGKSFPHVRKVLQSKL